MALGSRLRSTVAGLGSLLASVLLLVIWYSINLGNKLSSFLSPVVDLERASVTARQIPSPVAPALAVALVGCVALWVVALVVSPNATRGVGSAALLAGPLALWVVAAGQFAAQASGHPVSSEGMMFLHSWGEVLAASLVLLVPSAVFALAVRVRSSDG